jgi:DNA ligase-4
MTQAGEEGLVVKDLLSTYILAERTKRWVKMKPDYSNMAADLDLIVLGVYHGEGVGFRGKGLYTLLLGAKATMSEGEGKESGDVDPNSAEAIAERVRNTRYETVTKMGSGYTFDVLQDLRERLTSIIKPYDYQRPPPHLKHWNPKADDRPHYYIPPEDSFVVTIKCGELVPTAAFTAGLTCRFPRLVQLRYDKPLTDIISVPELREIKDRPVANIQVSWQFPTYHIYKVITLRLWIFCLLEYVV